MTTTLVYDACNELLGETNVDEILDGLAMNWTYNNSLQRDALALDGITGTYNVLYGYDLAGWLHAVNSGANGAVYSYLANSLLVRQIVFTNSGYTRMTTTKAHDYLNRLTQIQSVPSGSSVVSFDYSYNHANLRIQSTLADGSYWIGDPAGNLTNDGRWNYYWDAENRLVKLAPSTSAGPQISLRFEYDWQGRRIRKQVWPNANWSDSPTNDLKFVYDGWNLVAILHSDFSLLNSFVWGSDLSGTPQGAGGVGGLLEVTYNGRTDGTIADAMQHCLAACRLMHNKGPCLFDWVVKKGLKDHGDGKTDPPARTDFANNDVGIAIKGDCLEGCKDALKRGKLTCIDKATNLVPCRLQ